MKRIFYTFFAILVTTSLATAQEKGNGKLSGTILDSSTNQPVEFATVALIDPATNKPVDGTVADEKGKFSISGIALGNYRVTISFIGYETYLQEIALTEKRSSIDLGVLKLGASVTQLNEVVVEGERSLVEEKVDRMVYNAENDATARGGDAADVLRRVPMLTVDMDGNVSMRGNQNILVLINNKPSTITASSVADALKQIPADQIKTVEVITSPSAKYDAEGSAGIINIITKKNNMQGFTFNVDTNVGLRGSHLGLNTNFRTGKMGFSLGGWGRANYNVTGSYENNQTTYDPATQIETSNIQTASTLNRGIFGNYNFGWDYEINKFNSLVASVRFGARNGRNLQDDLITQSFVNGALTRSSLRNVNTVDDNGNVDANLTYTRTFETTGKELSIMGSLSRNNRTNDFINDIYEENGVPMFSSIKNNNISYNQEATVQADYQTPIGDKQIVEFGAKNISRIVSSKYQYFTATGEDGEYVLSTNQSLSNNLDYNQNVAAGYFAYTATLPKGYSLKAGTRYEYTNITANFQDEQAIEIPSYGVIVPSANLSKKLKTGTVKAAYNRRIQRPSLRYLNPNIQGSNPLNVTQGDPTLSPEYTNNYELSYSTFFKKSSLNISAFARNTNNAIQDVRDVRGDTIRTTFQNIGREDSYGSSIFMNISLSDKFTLNGGTDFYYRVLNNQNPDPIYAASNTGWVVSGRMFGNYNLTKVWALQFFGFMRGRDVQLQGTRGGFGMYSLSVRREFGDKRGSIGFGAENFFNVNGFTIKSETVSPILTQRSTNVMNNMSFKVNFSLRLGKMSFDQRPGRNRSINNDDLKQGGDGGGMDGGEGGQGQGQGQGGMRGGMGNFNGGQRGPSARPAAPAANPAAAKADPNAVVDATGTWTYTLESPQGGNGTITIRKEGDNYSGTIVNARFNRENQLKSVVVKGNEIEMSYDVNMGGNNSTMTIKGTITGDTLDGVMTVGSFGAFPIKAKKNP